MQGYAATVRSAPKKVGEEYGSPIRVGGDGPAALRWVARYDDGWLPMNHTLDLLPASLHKLGTLWDEQRRSGRPQISIGLQVE